VPAVGRSYFEVVAAIIRRSVRTWWPTKGSGFLYADLGLSNEPCEDHAAYLASWLKVL
jgi:hypothetical protein